MSKKIAAVALSGGVDSAASAYILKQQGFEVFGITMKNFESFDVEPAKYVANKLNIKHYVVDLVKLFENEIINEFVNEYVTGKTPNPCMMCNKKIKYGYLMNEAKNLGAEFLATGHYAKIKYDNENNIYKLFKSNDKRKDQTYFLYHLSQKQLSSVIFPLESYENKLQVRELVKNIVPETFEKKDSLNICFIQNMSHSLFIKKRLNLINDKGNFIDKNGKFIAKHKGIYNYTIGQKRGLGIKGEKPKFVVKINHKTNEITLGDDIDTYKEKINIVDVSFIDESKFKINSFECEVKLCQWGYFIPCTVYNNENKTASIKFHKAERAPAVGQSAVFYYGDEIIGGGTII